MPHSTGPHSKQQPGLKKATIYHRLEKTDMEKLNILWTTDNKDTVFNMLSMYTTNSIKNTWWDEINVIIWGASAKLVGNDTQVQTEVMEMMARGVHVEACKACSDNLGVTEKLIQLGIHVRYMGNALTGYLKSNDKFISI